MFLDIEPVLHILIQKITVKPQISCMEKWAMTYGSI